MSSHETTLRLPLELTNGNDGRTQKYFQSAKARKDFEAYLKAMGHTKRPYGFPVRLVLTRILGKGQRAWDNDSGLRGNAKELLDSLTACGWWHDDSPRWITAVDFRQDSTQRASGPAIVIDVYRESD